MASITRLLEVATGRHTLATTIIAIGALVLLLQTQGKKLRHDWSPVGIGVKALLLVCVGYLLYLPYATFVNSPTAAAAAMRLS